MRENYWKKEEEELLKQWSDKAQCYQWLHMRARDIYQRKNAIYTIPVIIISTIVGTANFAQDRFSEDDRKYVTMGIGSLSIIAGIISTISQFLKVPELAEAHRVASISWGKFYRNVKTELSRHPLDRDTPYQIINFNKKEFDKLVEMSPAIPKKILKEFKAKFKNIENLIIPEMCDKLTATAIYDISDEDRDKIIDEFVNTKKKDKKDINNQNNEIEERYKETFFNLNGRYPSSVEIKNYVDKLKDNNDEELEEDSDEEEIINENRDPESIV